MDEQGVSRAEDGRPRRRPSRGMYVLPSLFTALNIGAGYYAITQSIQGSAAEPGYFDRAALAIGFAILFDGVDGRIARMTRTTSDFGKELDSLADVVTFGVAPSILAYIWGFRRLPIWTHPVLRDQIIHFGVFACFVFLICGASRLARFNISVNPQPRNPGRADRKYFVGMPIPAGAGVLASVSTALTEHRSTISWIALVWLLLVLFTGFLMVSTWRFWSGKELNLGSRHPFQLVAFLAFLGAVVVRFSEYALIIVALGLSCFGCAGEAGVFVGTIEATACCEG